MNPRLPNQQTQPKTKTVEDPNKNKIKSQLPSILLPRLLENFRTWTVSTTQWSSSGMTSMTSQQQFVWPLQVLEESEIEVEYPIVIEVDNVGAIYMANNHTTSQRTKPVDTRYHFVGNYVEDGILKGVFVISETRCWHLYQEHHRSYSSGISGRVDSSLNG